MSLPRRSLAALALAFAVGCTQEETGAPSQPNLLLVTVTSLDSRAFDADWRQDLVTPSFDTLAEEGVVFSNTVALSQTGDGGYATMLTGLHPRRHGAWFSFYDLAPEHETLAETLKARGYRTAAFTTASPTAEMRGFQQGFDVFAAPDNEEAMEGRPRKRVLSEALDWIRAQSKQEEPWFAWVMVGLPWPPESAEELSDAQRRSLPDAEARELAFSLGLDGLKGHHAQRIQTDLRHVELDGELTPFLDLLRDDPTGTTIAITALRGANRQLGMYEPMQGYDVPLVIAGAGVTGGRVEARPATHADLYPTLLGLLSMPSDAGTADGLNLFAADLPGARLLVLDLVGAGRPTQTHAIYGSAVVGRGEFAGIEFHRDDFNEPAPPEDAARAKAEYAAWSQDLAPDSGRRPGLEEEWGARIDAYLESKFGSLQEQVPKDR